MQVFHEGLPGAGKSYESCVMHILPAIKSGRTVITNIDGINHAKFADLSGIPENLLRNILICYSFSDEPDIQKRVLLQRDAIIENSVNDCLVVIDEVQDLFPTSRQKLSPEHQKFFTEHRHEGQDIILMGQDLRDVHPIIRRRVHRKIVFTKMTALGLNSRYKWTAFEATSAEKFNKISSGTRNYEKKYFGLYSSHTGGTKNTDTYADKRTNLLKSPAIVWGIPAAFVAAIYAVNFLVGFFNEPNFGKDSDPDPRVSTVQAAPPPVALEEARDNLANGTESSQPKAPPEPLDVFERDLQTYRARLAGYVVSDTRHHGVIEIVDGSLHTKDRYSLEAIEWLGWHVTITPAGLQITKQDRSHIVRPWPIDPFGRVPDNTRSRINQN